MMDAIERGQGVKRTDIPLKRIYSDNEWTAIFRRFDHDNDDRISVQDFLHQLHEISDGDLPITVIEKALNEADKNNDNVITLAEFLKLVKKSRQGKSKYGGYFIEYVRRTVPPRTVIVRRINQDLTDGEYEDEYSCYPPPLAMIVISLLEIGIFMYDSATRGYGRFDGPAATALMYNPHRRREAWRFLTYMFVHVGAFHLIVNLAVQILLGLPLEMVHRWWRVVIVYTAGVVAGSLGTSVSDPNVYLAGASGGVYALIAAHIATIIMNWSEMQFAFWQLIIFLLIASLDIGTAVYNRYVLDIDDQVGYAAHLAGAVAGLLVGIYVLRNLQVRRWEKKIWWVAIVIYILLMAAGIIINVAIPSYFPVQYTDEQTKIFQQEH
ncbi:rhomboid-4 isoform X2 [Rhodnius prolixus]|uniref:rhomboid-4 isoform X1 n=1 Tax=Rhodnius prolixus TaxID=13249 RepID=UPI003D18E764